MDAEERAERYGDTLLSHRDAGEADRLTLLTQAWDPVSRQVLTDLGIAPDARCLEVGAGLGTMANWLAQQCPQGRVVATDLDTGFLAERALPGVEVLRHDVASDDFPAGSFDLIHIRSLLTHVRDRDEVLRKIAGWLAPGGVLCIADASTFPAASSPYPVVRKVVRGVEEMLRQVIGSDVTDWPRSFPRPLQAAGLVEVGLRVHCDVATAGTPFAEMNRRSVRVFGPKVVAGGTVTEAEIEEYHELLGTPGFLDLTSALMIAWGRAPR